MGNLWFRMYGEFANDAKVQMMSEIDQRRYVMVLCLRCNGDVTLQDEEVAFQLRISAEEWSRTKALFVAKGLLSEDNRPSAWEKRQFASDSSAARVAKHRAKARLACNVTCNSDETKSNAVDTDTDTETEEKQKTIRAARFDAQAHLLSLGIPSDLASDWIKLRKGKKAEVTKTAIEGVSAEAEKAGLSLDAALRECCARGWAGFKASWLVHDGVSARGSPVVSLEARNKAVADQWVPPEMRTKA